jgi:hypothetical protein
MNKSNSKKTLELAERRDAPLATRTDLSRVATKDITGAMNAILADVFALYLKTKNFHWHMSGPHFRDFQSLQPRSTNLPERRRGRAFLLGSSTAASTRAFLGLLSYSWRNAPVLRRRSKSRAARTWLWSLIPARLRS